MSMSEAEMWGEPTPEDLAATASAPDIRAAEQDDSTVVTMADVEPERVQWLWPGRLPLGKLVVLDGDPSVGKSTLTLDLAARVSAGRSWPDGAAAPKASGVLLLSAEDGIADTIAPRLAAAGADRRKVHALTEVELVDDEGKHRMVPPSLPRDIPVIARAIRKHRVRLAVVDVLMAYLGGGVDSHRDQDIRVVLHQLAAMAEATGCTVVLIRHLNKSGGGNALYRGGGSIGIIGAARAAFLVARDPEDTDRRVLAVTKMNIGTEPPALAYRLESDDALGCARVAWESDPVSITAGQLLTTVDAEASDEQSELVRMLTAIMDDAGGEIAAAEAVKQLRAFGAAPAKETLRRARKKAEIESVKGSFGGGWVWRYCHEGPTQGPEGPTSQGPGTFGSFVGPSAGPQSEPSGSRPHLAAVGQCADCGEPVASGRVRCPAHIAAMRRGESAS